VLSVTARGAAVLAGRQEGKLQNPNHKSQTNLHAAKLQSFKLLPKPEVAASHRYGLRQTNDARNCAVWPFGVFTH
jgi:hypothetical protein